MYAVILLLVVAMLSLLITRIATIALTATGMPQPSARFQAVRRSPAWVSPRQNPKRSSATRPAVGSSWR